MNTMSNATPTIGNFPSDIMEKFSLIDAPVFHYGDSKPRAPRPYYHWRGNLTEFFSIVREMKTSPKSIHINKPLRSVGESWAGMTRQKIPAMYESSRSIDAQYDFDSALATIIKEGKPAPAEYRVTGGVWSVPRYLTGHPQCAIYRPRTAKPPLNIDVVACFPSFAKAQVIADSLARIARACWDYQKTGGAATLTVHYCGKFARTAPGGCEGIIASIKVSLSDISSIATACSAPFFRAAFYPFASALSGEMADSIPVAWLAKPGAIRLQGDKALDAQALKAAGIK